MSGLLWFSKKRNKLTTQKKEKSHLDNIFAYKPVVKKLYQFLNIEDVVCLHQLSKQSNQYLIDILNYYPLYQNVKSYLRYKPANKRFLFLQQRSPNIKIKKRELVDIFKYEVANHNYSHLIYLICYQLNTIQFDFLRNLIMIYFRKLDFLDKKELFDRVFSLENIKLFFSNFKDIQIIYPLLMIVAEEIFKDDLIGTTFYKLRYADFLFSIATSICFKKTLTCEEAKFYENLLGKLKAILFKINNDGTVNPPLFRELCNKFDQMLQAYDINTDYDSEVTTFYHFYS